MAGDATWSIEERMRHYRVPGLSIAVFGEGKILWAKGYGQTDAEPHEPVTAQTPFDAGTIAPQAATPSDLARIALDAEAQLRAGQDGSALGLTTEGAYFTNGAAAEGSRALLLAHRTKGYGVALMTNSDEAGELLREVVRAVAAAYGWDEFEHAPVALAKVAPADLAALAGRYRVDAGSALTLSVRGARLEGRQTLDEPFELLPVEANAFVRRDEETRYVCGPEGLRLVTRGASSDAPRLAAGERLLDEQLCAGSLDSALEGYRALHEANPQDPVVDPVRLERHARALLERNDFPAALALLRLAAEFQPDSARALDSLAEGMEKSGDRVAALALYRQALELASRPNAPRPWQDAAVRTHAGSRIEALTGGR